MSNLKQLQRELDEEYGPDMCTVCSKPTHMKDAIGFPWCEDHAHHGQVLSWGYRHGYPELIFHPYGIYGLSAGEWSWWNRVVLTPSVGDVEGNEDYMWQALVYLEYLDSLKNVG